MAVSSRTEKQNEEEKKEEDTKDKEIDISQYWWHVNKGGFPICQETWERMWKYVAVAHPEGQRIAQSIREKTTKKVQFPAIPYLSSSSLPPESLVTVQTYLQQLQYNHTGTQFFDVRKNRPLSRLMELAKEMIRESLPIKCLEAVVLTLYLTAPLTSTQRFTIGFKSFLGGRYYRHIVLGVHHGGLYGALGLSRRSTLMYKPLQYKALSELLDDFINSYEQCRHNVIRIKISSPIVHDVHSCELIQWKFVVIPLQEIDHSDMKKISDKYSKTLRTYAL